MCTCHAAQTLPLIGDSMILTGLFIFSPAIGVTALFFCLEAENILAIHVN